MDTTEIRAVLVSDPQIRRYFKGVLACDELPGKIPNYPAAYVINTQPKRQPGEHWIALYFQNPNCAEFFCSFGIPPTGPIWAFAKPNSKYTFIIPIGYRPHTRKCARFIVSISFRCRGIPLVEILTHFHNFDWRKNDALVSAVLSTLTDV